MLPVLGSYFDLHLLSPYARTCQAANFLSRVNQNLGLGGIDASIRHADALQLHDDIQRLCRVVNAEAKSAAAESADGDHALRLLASRGMCFSALLTLYEEYSCAASTQPSDGVDSGWLEMQKRSISGLRQLTDQISQLASDVQGLAGTEAAIKVCPLVANSLYGLAYTYLWYLHETGDSSYQPLAESVKTTLQILGQTWRCASKYTANPIIALRDAMLN